MPFALYIINFPQLIAGPIVRYRPISAQLTERTATFVDFETGVVRFAVGLAKKLLIANPIGAVADHLFALSPADLPVWGVWLAVVCYAIQIYFDFSGYSDMAIGISLMFGIFLPVNFNSPYKAISIVEFWRRWHMTLSQFLRDYLYIPLGGNRRGRVVRYVNLMITMLLGGLWHGAAWTFVAWGALHGAGWTPIWTVAPGIRTVTWSATPPATRCSRRLAWVISARCSAPISHVGTAHPGSTC